MRAAGAALLAIVFTAVADARAGEPVIPQAPRLPAVPYPPENPPTDAKRVLGKMLFFEEQLSSDDTVACATCHVMSKGGTDPRRSVNPGTDGMFGTSGDVLGSPGVVSMRADGAYDPFGTFGLHAQVTPRTSPSPFTALFAPATLWDGRATGTFVDPVTQSVEIAAGGALESQAILPLTNPVEMGHAGRDWPAIIAKLERSMPLALADRLPPDLQAAVGSDRDYGDLFQRAFGDRSITPTRIAMAIATYERTLLPDQTDYDRFLAGDTTALTKAEQRGLRALSDAGCVTCHAPPLFTDESFRATGVRPPADDPSRAMVTQDAGDRGRFKVPSLRNVALKRSFFHDGKRTTLEHAIRFYGRAGGRKRIDASAAGAPGQKFATTDAMNVAGAPTPSGGSDVQPYGDQPDEVRFVDNVDPAMDDIELTRRRIQDIESFLTGGLVDPRVQDETFPFDRPVLLSERADLQPRIMGPGQSGLVGVPRIVIETPAFPGNDGFRVGLSGGSSGGTARLISWTSNARTGTTPEVESPAVLLTMGSSRGGGGSGSVFHPIPDTTPAGTILHFVWRVDDRHAAGGTAESPRADVPVIALRTAADGGSGIDGGVAPPATVDDGNAYVGSAAFRVEWGAHGRNVNVDRLTLSARLNPRGVGADLSHGRLSITVGGARILDGAALNAAGRVRTPGAVATFDPATGSVEATVKWLDLSTVFAGTRDGDRGSFEVPIVLSVEGIGLAEPTATAQAGFVWRRRAAGVAAGHFNARRTATDAGAFQMTRIRADRRHDDRVRIRARAVLDAPGTTRFEAPGGLVVTLGDGAPITVAREDLVGARSGGTLTARGVEGITSLRIDPERRSVQIEALFDVPSLLSSAPGTRVPLRVRIEARPAAGFAGQSFETVPEVELTGARVGDIVTVFGNR